MTEPLVKRYLADEKLAQRIERGKFRLIGPTGHRILPQIWPHSISPGFEVFLQIDEDDVDNAKDGTVSAYYP